MPRRDNYSKREQNYIKKLAEDLRSFREREEAGEKISERAQEYSCKRASCNAKDET